MSTKFSGLKERDELRAFMENLQAKEDPTPKPSGTLTKRIRTMLTNINSQLQVYDSCVGSSVQMISADMQGRILVQDVENLALDVIKHKLDDVVGQAVIQNLDVDKDGFVEIEHVLGLVLEEGLGEPESSRNLLIRGRIKVVDGCFSIRLACIIIRSSIPIEFHVVVGAVVERRRVHAIMGSEVQVTAASASKLGGVLSASLTAMIRIYSE